ncbi:uncharacterized protein BX663DRAFT_558058 [Cokeromyces recurvatus]|uniref:uncharacterized protein n=1 Tax=Cokeromyces recurvatus TaxID=90255 RepID=UPI002220E879|nr:uncharacterized protein BX663DRAFT_558058 [Cokeromyces recurvatus]KAI7906387.1 hypothetical protein BX663DRAFT_558058 [Cokeromyces recurvatus]
MPKVKVIYKYLGDNYEAFTRKLVNTSNSKDGDVLTCKVCHKVWQRDANAARNMMMMISEVIWSVEGIWLILKPKKKSNIIATASTIAF